MPLVRRRRPLLRAVAIACGAYSAGKPRRQGPQDRRLDQRSISPDITAFDAREQGPDRFGSLRQWANRDS